MARVQSWQCDDCKDIIPEKPDTSVSTEFHGYIIRGGIYVAEDEGNGGLIGKSDGKGEYVYCTSCFCKALGIKMAVMRGV